MLLAASTAGRHVYSPKSSHTAEKGTCASNPLDNSILLGAEAVAGVFVGASEGDDVVPSGRE